tara:strand:- start:1460 stop:1627 length:168 start_codon:yes stop_codon:yes gene_type:complete
LFPSQLLERLNCDEDSPLCNLLRTQTMPDGVIKDDSLLRTLQNSITDGAFPESPT